MFVNGIEEDESYVRSRECIQTKISKLKICVEKMKEDSVFGGKMMSQEEMDEKYRLY